MESHSLTRCAAKPMVVPVLFALIIVNLVLARARPAVLHPKTQLRETAQGFTYPLFHRDAPSSVIRDSAANTNDLPDDMPMKNFVGIGRAIQARRHYHGRRYGRYVEANFSYFGEEVGDFYLIARVGTPPRNLIFILDTGSELIWTRCSPCSLCNGSEAPIFNTSHSSSYIRVPCGSPLCTQSTGFSGGSCANDTSKSCVWATSYGDGSLDAGYLSLDNFAAGSIALPLAFGCAIVDIETVQSTPNSGIMGLNAGPFSFVSQLEGHGYAKKFSYCMPARLTASNSSGVILFGESVLSSSLDFTPLVPRYPSLGSLYYYLDMIGISVGKKWLAIPASAFKTNVIGRGGTVLDSGTAITHLVDSAYVPLVRELRRATASLHPFSDHSAGADVCYRIPISASQLPQIPTISFHFLHGASLELDADSVLYAVAVEEDTIVVCAAITNSVPGLALNVIGNYQQQNYWIEYDLQNYRVGFGKANCAMD